jgi:hypothetical protein
MLWLPVPSPGSQRPEALEAPGLLNDCQGGDSLSVTVYVKKNLVEVSAFLSPFWLMDKFLTLDQTEKIPAWNPYVRMITFSDVDNFQCYLSFHFQGKRRQVQFLSVCFLCWKFEHVSVGE